MKHDINNYLIGFGSSLALTVIAFVAVTEKIFSRDVLLTLLAVTAIAQVCLQLFFFLHLRDESKPRWQIYAFEFMTIVAVIVVFGSIWIMNNLHYNMMPAENVTEYIQDKENIDQDKEKADSESHH